MNPQDFNALIKSIQEVTKSIKNKDSTLKCINSFSILLDMIEDTEKITDLKKLHEKVLQIKVAYLRIAIHLLNENN